MMQIYRILLVSEKQLMHPITGRGMNSMFQDIVKNFSHAVIMRISCVFLCFM